MADETPIVLPLPEPNLVAHEKDHWLAVIDKMLDKNVGADLLSKVFEMQCAWEKEQQRKSFVSAFSAFKKAAPAAIARTGMVGFESKGQKVGYKHVELDVACAALIPHLSEYGLAHSWETQQAENGQITVTCHIEHRDGHSKSVTLRGMPDTSGSKNAIQAVGSAVYYLQRYTFLSALGIAQGGDDDGSSKTDRPTEDQMRQLCELLEETGHTAGSEKLERFKKWCQVEKIDDITAAFMPKAIDALAKQKKAKTEPAKAETPKAEPAPVETGEEAPKAGRVSPAWVKAITDCKTVEALKALGDKFTATTKNAKGEPFSWTQGEIGYFGFFYDAHMSKLKGA